MADGTFRVFLSAVSSEFASARDALADALQAHDVIVRVQRSFRDDPDAPTLLDQLAGYIKTCDAVVCLIGTRSGAGFPKPRESPPYLAQNILPPGIAEASYTQWEYFLDGHFGVRRLVYFATPDFRPDQPDPPKDDRPGLQSAFAAHVECSGKRAPRVDSSGDFRAEVLKDLLQAPLPRDLRAGLRNDLQALRLKPIVLPYPSLGTLFMGRGTFLTRLRASLTRPGGGTAAIAGKAVHGMGGVGKTRAAVEYAWAHQDEHTALALIDAETPDKLDAGLAALTGPLRLAEHTATDQKDQVEAALAWLNANPGWFLILDNIDAQPALDAAHRLLGRLHGGQVVLTSRLDRFPREVERLDLDVLALDDAAEFLLAATAAGRRPAPEDAAQARALAEALGQLALALEMAAATIEARRLSFAQYREMWAGSRARVIGWAQQEITGYHHAVAEAWDASVRQLTAPGRRLLDRLAFLAPDPVPASLLDVPVPGVEAQEEAHAALDDLAAYSLATRDAEGGAFLVHRLVQDVTRRGVEQAGTARERLAEALGWVNAAVPFETDDVRNWPRLDPLAPHAEAVAGRADAAGIADPTARLMNELGTLFWAKALHARAEPLLRRALSIGEASLGKDHPEVATGLNNLAALLQATNRLGEAEPLLRRALAIDEASFGKDHPDVARDLNNLAQLLQATNRLGEAEKLMRRALAIAEASLGKDHPAVAGHLNSLAVLLRDTDRPAEAEPLFRRALAVREASLGPLHPQLTYSLSHLAQLLQSTGRFHEAEPLLRRALRIDEASYGAHHPEVADDLGVLARLLQATNRLGEAKPLLRRALAIFLAFQRDTGHAHPSRDTAIANYRVLLTAMGKSEAEIEADLAPLWREAGLEPG